MRKLPPLKALRAFEAAARHMSFKAAANELGLTPTAISHQIRTLEDSLARALFRRRPRPLALTAAGSALFPILRDGLDAFAEAAALVRDGTSPSNLRVTTTNAFAARWLLPRLPAWRAAHPEIMMEVIGTDAVVDLVGGDADLAVRYAFGPPAGLVCTELLRDQFWPLASPRLISAGNLIRRPSQLARHPFIHAGWPLTEPHAPTWQRWLTAARQIDGDITLDIAAGGLMFREELHAIDAVIAGQGIGLLSDVLVERELASGELVKLFDLALPGFGFYLVYPNDHLQQKLINQFLEWILSALDPLDTPKPQQPAVPAIQPLWAPPRLSIVVLAFANIGGDNEQEYFVDGITESLTTDLSRISGALVIASNSAFAYKGRAIDLRQIGRDLNVRYALEGSVQRGGNRLRLNVQLIDCDTSTHLWAERFDQELADLFDMQDEIVARLAGELGAQLVEAEARRAERSLDPDSVDLYFRARALMNRGSTAEYLKAAEALLERALALDPNNVDALAAKGWVDMDLGAGFMTDDRAARLTSAEAVAIKALSLAPGHAFAHLVLGSFYSAVDRAEEAIATFEHALMLDRNFVYTHALIGMAKTALGRADEAEIHYREALRLSPFDVAAHHWMSSAGTSKLHQAGDEEAVAWFRRAIEANRNFAFTHLSLAAALAHLGRIDEARAAAKAGLALEPSFTIGRFRAGARSDNRAYLSGRERIYEGMRRAGVPE